MHRYGWPWRLATAVLLAGQLGGSVLHTVAAAETCSANRQTTRTRCDPYCYNSDYLFAVTRELHDGSASPVVAALVSPLTIAVDLVVLPFEIALGLFG